MIIYRFRISLDLDIVLSEESSCACVEISFRALIKVGDVQCETFMNEPKCLEVFII